MPTCLCGSLQVRKSLALLYSTTAETCHYPMPVLEHNTALATPLMCWSQTHPTRAVSPGKRDTHTLSHTSNISAGCTHCYRSLGVCFCRYISEVDVMVGPLQISTADIGASTDSRLGYQASAVTVGDMATISLDQMTPVIDAWPGYGETSYPGWYQRQTDGVPVLCQLGVSNTCHHLCSSRMCSSILMVLVQLGGVLHMNMI